MLNYDETALSSVILQNADIANDIGEVPAWLDFHSPHGDFTIVIECDRFPGVPVHIAGIQNVPENARIVMRKLFGLFEQSGGFENAALAIISHHASAIQSRLS